MILWALTAWVVSQAAPASTGWDNAPGIMAPLGSLTDSVSMLPKGGLPANEPTQIVDFPGCTAKQVLWPQRFAAGAVLAARKMSEWARQPLPEKVLKNPDSVLAVMAFFRKSPVLKSSGCVDVDADGW